jgi:ATP-dependent exoDNAse (exonuclease V) alpha subunit
MSAVNLTEQQTAVWKKLEIFLASPGKGIFILRGFAGTGKTTIMQKLGLHLRSQKRKFALLAPTGRAAAVLSSKTGLTATTIHSELYKFSDIEGEPNTAGSDVGSEEFGQMTLQFTIRTQDTEDRVFIVDEASMVSDEVSADSSFAQFGSGRLLSDLLLVAGKNKIIFCGDPAQLPPVGSLESQALSDKFFRFRKLVVTSMDLTEILRQRADSHILPLASKVRRLTERQDLTKWIKIPARPSQDITLMSYMELKEHYINSYRKGEWEKSIAICNSNANNLDISKAVRAKHFGANAHSIEVGDSLIITQNNALYSFVNGDFAIVEKVGPTHSHCFLRFQEVVIKVQYGIDSHSCLLCLSPLEQGRPNISNEQQRALMIDFSQRMRRKGVRPKSDAYFHALQTDKYLNSVRANYGYAITCHKSQGGEWRDVYFFLHKGMYAMPPEALSRWWYTGITRAKEKLYLVNDWWIQ